MLIILNKMEKIFTKIASGLALFIGGMSVFAGSRVLLGIDEKDYAILTWLVSYNVLFGVISIFTAYLIWTQRQPYKKMVLGILSMHFFVFVFLKFIGETAASDSIKAMIFRMGIWSVISVFAILIPKYILKK